MGRELNTRSPTSQESTPRKAPFGFDEETYQIGMRDVNCFIDTAAELWAEGVIAWHLGREGY